MLLISPDLLFTSIAALLLMQIPRSLLTSNCSWTKHINILNTQASSTTDYIKQNLKLGLPQLRQVTYETYIHPNLEDAPTTWSLNAPLPLYTPVY